MMEIFERLVAAGIQLLPSTQITTHFVFERDGFAALVERKGDAFGSIGSAGLLGEKGFAPLVLRNGETYFVARGFEQSASPEQVQGIRRFQSDLQSALEQPAAS
ncbi:MAG TPA: hypothetical protein VMZ52_05015 [Bryobacteraceae bacterium]|nr:hypothetical protein [Bryobacteraceae bacterium]